MQLSYADSVRAGKIVVWKLGDLKVRGIGRAGGLRSGVSGVYCVLSSSVMDVARRGCRETPKQAEERVQHHQVTNLFFP